MNRLLLDTHIWIWHVSGSRDLPQGLRDVIDSSAGQLWLSPVSIWEAGTLVQRGRFRIRIDYLEWVRRAFDLLPLMEAPVSFEVARRLQTFELPQNDPADNLLAATALVYGLTLMTVDRELCSASWLPVLTV